ncbi:bifunctional biotin--[acetyl-CoA-carboxylase] ligase/biotin operon repressor BirA [Colwellia sp. D2M02]|uniref:bifunctional biotin--[acetyl-CoA-carboxylase] ligase/biotin operon repressor BirA n=1 Tax=Colwellia sp. D2M02 TaxID=2841562 RepID=UPI001C0817D2|nr:bifunctional biotin--[acetyl-CoA-carboxylase] ligase/biotin operon repressor BirA [Colwellia sp. D2M02]MBU2892223.1 bifunctional biotin--[acetyl-CoA-carboxylase] ligase/biotin operon repressor BirA [Colwellia sp. D2M02]
MINTAHPRNSSNSVKAHLVRSLANGSFISGQVLAQELNISRAAIAKHIKSLLAMGLDIYSVTGKGYKLATPLTLLDEKNIERSLRVPEQLLHTVNPHLLEVHSLIDSTNDHLMRLIPERMSQGRVCLAEYQSAGRGRRGRQWVSPFGSQIYLSMYWYLEQGLAGAMGLSLVTALAVSDAVKNYCDIQVELKWPNDIYLSGVKLAGILIDLEGQALEPSHSVIGIGLNVNMPTESAKSIDQQWTDLKSHTNITIDRDGLCAELISCLWERLLQHRESGLSEMLDEWHKYDIYLNKPVKLLTGERTTHGICRGINNQGALLLDVDGYVKAIYGGEVSLRGIE